MNDTKFMKMALSLAEQGCGWVNPNPMVGAVVVKAGTLIGRGYHQKYGELHAERNALADCKESTAGATLYVTLEPCCHHGRTPPCTEAIIEAGITRVVIGSSDPNPLVDGKGTAVLREHGIEVTESVLKTECDNLNQSYLHYIKNKTPYVVMKYAMTMDGKISTKSGESQWITGIEARGRVHEDRHRYSAILVGVGTVIADNPMLTCRIEHGRNPLRIVCDTKLRTPWDSNLVVTAKEINTLLVTSITDPNEHQPYLDAGCEILVVPKKDGYIDLVHLMQRLGERQIDSVLIEGGGTLNWSALQSGVVNKVQAYLAPKIFGGSGHSPVGGTGIASIGDAFLLSVPVITRLGQDLLLESEVIPCLPES